MNNTDNKAGKLVYEAPKCITVMFAETEKAATISIDGFDIKASWLRSGS